MIRRSSDPVIGKEASGQIRISRYASAMIHRPSIFGLAFCLLFCFVASAHPLQTAPTSSRNSAPSSANVQQLFVAGETALRSGDLVTAEQDFRKVVAADPQLAGAYANLGVIAMRRRQWNQALTLLKHAERLAPSVAGIRLNVGLVYFRQNNFAAAIEPFASVVKEQPESSQARYLLGLCYFFTDKPAEAVDTLDPLWAEQSNQLSYLYVLGNAAAEANRKDEEQKALSRLVEIGGDSPEFHLFMGKAHLNREEYDQAISELQTAAKMNPKLPFVHFNLGLAYAHNEDYNNAKQEFLKDIALEPDVAYSYDRLGTVEWHLKQNAEAEQNFHKALKLDSRLTSSRFGLAQIFNQEGKYSAALSELDQGIKTDPDNNSLHYLRGRVLLRLNRKQEAEAELNTATRLLQSQRESRQKELYGTLPHPELTNQPQ